VTSSLREVQRWLAGIILEPESLDAGGLDPSEALTTDAATARVRLGAYVGGYPARLEEALAEAFPALRHVLGADAFHGLVARYLPHVPAGIYNLNDVGANLPAYVAEDALAHGLPLAPDLARLELAVQRAFHATLAPAFDRTPLAAWTPVDWEQAVLRFQRGVAVVRSRWPIHDVWKARTQPRDAMGSGLDAPAQDVVVFRRAWRVAVDAVDADEAGVLDGLLRGERLGEAMTRLEASGVTDETVTAWFAGWVARGMLVGCER
jgi:hypothetical protein